MSSIDNNRFTFQLIFISILTLFVFHIFNDLDLDSQYFVNINAVEIANNYDRKERIDLNYIFDSSEYFEEDNVPQNNNININNNINKNNQIKQELEEQTYNQIKKEEKASSSSNSNNNNNNDNKKYEFTSIESKNNENYDIKSNDYVTFNARINLNNIEKDGFLRIVGYINGQSFNEDIQLSEFSPAKNRLDIKFNVLKDTEIVSLGTSDEFFVCAYHIKDIEIEYDSILYFDCNEAGVQDSDGKNTINVFKPSSMVYSKSRALYDEIQLQGQQYSEISKPITDNVDYNDDKVLLKIISPLSDRKNTKELKIAAMVKGQIQTETIKDVQQELAKSNDDTITRTFTFDRNTDIGQIQLGDRFHACVSSDDLNPPEGQECEKRLVKKFNSPNPLPAR
jgi:hypothetical protein